MATKTISIDLEAYERLRAARRAEKESFSQVIKRAEWHSEAAEWNAEPKTIANFLKAIKSLPPTEDAILDQLEENQRNDLPPDDHWAEPERI